MHFTGDNEDGLGQNLKRSEVNLDQYWLMGELRPALFQDGSGSSLLVGRAVAILSSLEPGCEGPRAGFPEGA